MDYRWRGGGGGGGGAAECSFCVEMLSNNKRAHLRTTCAPFCPAPPLVSLKGGAKQEVANGRLSLRSFKITVTLSTRTLTLTMQLALCRLHQTTLLQPEASPAQLPRDWFEEKHLTDDLFLNPVRQTGSYLCH